MATTTTTEADSTMSTTEDKKVTDTNYLRGTRVYLSGPMGFVASHVKEKKVGWRSRVGEFLNAMGAVVFDPWSKPVVHGFRDYGVEKVSMDKIPEIWSFEQTEAGNEARADCAELFRSTFNIDLRMVDTSDFIIAYCPTNIYSVGTAHEIVRARAQAKPVLLISPVVDFSSLHLLREHLKDDKTGSELLENLVTEVPIKPNLKGIPNSWYMPFIDSTTFFDGFGFGPYKSKFNWPRTALDDYEEKYPLKNPLFPYLEKLARQIPDRWDNRLKKRVPNYDWLLWDHSYLTSKETSNVVDKSESK